MGIFKYALFLCKVNFKIPVFVVRREKTIYDAKNGLFVTGPYD